MQALQVALAAASLLVEPDLLAEETDKNHHDAQGSRRSGRIPAHRITEREEEQTNQADQPDDRSEHQECSAPVALLAPEVLDSSPERPRAKQAAPHANNPATSEGEAARLHDRGR